MAICAVREPTEPDGSTSNPVKKYFFDLFLIYF